MNRGELLKLMHSVSDEELGMSLKDVHVPGLASIVLKRV